MLKGKCSSYRKGKSFLSPTVLKIPHYLSSICRIIVTVNGFDSMAFKTICSFIAVLLDPSWTSMKNKQTN